MIIIDYILCHLFIDVIRKLNCFIFKNYLDDQLPKCQTQNEEKYLRKMIDGPRHIRTSKN